MVRIIFVHLSMYRVNYTVTAVKAISYQGKQMHQLEYWQYKDCIITDTGTRDDRAHAVPSVRLLHEILRQSLGVGVAVRMWTQ